MPRTLYAASKRVAPLHSKRAQGMLVSGSLQIVSVHLPLCKSRNTGCPSLSREDKQEPWSEATPLGVWQRIAPIQSCRGNCCRRRNQGSAARSRQRYDSCRRRGRISGRLVSASDLRVSSIQSHVSRWRRRRRRRRRGRYCASWEARELGCLEDCCGEAQG